MTFLSKSKRLSFGSTLIISAVIYFTLNLVQAWQSQIIDDEAYYFMWSQNPAWGYFDHPPMIAWWDTLGFFLLQNTVGLRLFTIFFSALGYFILGHFLVKNKKELILYNLLFFSMVLFQVFGFIATPDAPLLFFSILYLILLYHFIQKQSYLNTFSLGLGMALVMYSKYHGALLITFSLLPLIPVFYKNAKAYLAILIALVFYSPHLIWQFQHDFISFNYHIIRRNAHSSFDFKNPINYLLSVIYISSPFLFFYLIKAFYKFPKDLFKKSLWFIFWLSIVFFLFTSFKRYIQAQWSLITVIPLFILGFDYLKNKKKFFKPLKILSLITIGLIFLARIYFMIPNPPFKIKYHGWKEFMLETKRKTNGNAVFDRYQLTSLYSFYNYPERAYNIATEENRTSQFQLWNDIEEINGEPYTYFSSQLNATDSLALNSRKKEYYKYKKGTSFFNTASFWFQIEKAQISKSKLKLIGQIWNKSDSPITLAPENYTLHLILNQEKFSREIQQKIEIPFRKVNLASKHFSDFEFEVPVNIQDLTENPIGYLSLAGQNLPGTIRSNYITFVVDEND